MSFECQGSWLGLGSSVLCTPWCGQCPHSCLPMQKANLWWSFQVLLKALQWTPIGFREGKRQIWVLVLFLSSLSRYPEVMNEPEAKTNFSSPSRISSPHKEGEAYWLRNRLETGAEHNCSAVDVIKTGTTLSNKGSSPCFISWSVDVSCALRNHWLLPATTV